VGRRAIIISSGLAIAVLVSPLAQSATPKARTPKTKIQEPPKLFGSVGVNGKFGVRGEKGVSVDKLRSGWYTLTVNDETTAGNFRIKGPGVNKATGVKFRGAVIWGVNLQKGKYMLLSDSGSARTARTLLVS
jgi:hypothetical protein